MAAQPTDLQLCRIHSPDDENVAKVLTLSNAIFNADGSTKHGQLAYWRKQLAHPSSFIIYLAPTSAPDTPVAFVFVTHRVNDPPLRSGATDSVHIWLAGVLPEWRKGGCLGRMVRELDCVEELTVCTFPSRYPDMWRWLNGRGWVQERELADGKIMLSRSRGG